MSEIKTMAGMNDDELRESISSACKRHIPNIDLPPKYHVIVDALPMIYGEGMVKGYEFAESKFTEELALTKQKLADRDVDNRRLAEYAKEIDTDRVAAQLHIKELRTALTSALEVWDDYLGPSFTKGSVRDNAGQLLTKQPDNRALDRALLEARIEELSYAYSETKMATLDDRIGRYEDKLAELNKDIQK